MKQIESFFMGQPIFRKKVDEDQELYWIICGNERIFLSINNNTHKLTISPFQKQCQKIYDNVNQSDT